MLDLNRICIFEEHLNQSYVQGFRNHSVRPCPRFENFYHSTTVYPWIPDLDMNSEHTGHHHQRIHQQLLWKTVYRFQHLHEYFWNNSQQRVIEVGDNFWMLVIEPVSNFRKWSLKSLWTHIRLSSYSLKNYFLEYFIFQLLIKSQLWFLCQELLKSDLEN